jgi:uncharacterized protein YdbL (DUF1318 family)
MSRAAPLNLIALCALLSACVTINVYFPAAAAEKAADKIIEDVWGKQPQKPVATENDKQSDARSSGAADVLLAAGSNVLDFIVSPARADADLNISTPAVRQVQQSMQARHGQLAGYYQSGAVGLTANGLVEIHDQNAIPLAERNQVKKLVSDENSDRNALYREIAVATDIRNGKPIFAKPSRSAGFKTRRRVGTYKTQAAPGERNSRRNKKAPQCGALGFVRSTCTSYSIFYLEPTRSETKIFSNPPTGPFEVRRGPSMDSIQITQIPFRSIPLLCLGLWP